MIETKMIHHARYHNLPFALAIENIFFEKNILDDLFPREELGSSAPQGGNHEEEAPPRRFDPSLALESSGKGGFGT